MIPPGRPHPPCGVGGERDWKGVEGALEDGRERELVLICNKKIIMIKLKKKTLFTRLLGPLQLNMCNE